LAGHKNAKPYNQQFGSDVVIVLTLFVGVLMHFQHI